MSAVHRRPRDWTLGSDQLDYVKTRLIALDFVLGHPQHGYPETEAEKVAFFESELAVSREILPVKLYRARRSAEITPRYFARPRRIERRTQRCGCCPCLAKVR